MSLSWTIEFIKLELKYSWAISRNTSDFKINGFVKVTDGNNIGLGEVAPNIRYNETPENVQELFSQIKFQEFSNVESISDWLKNQNLPNALRFGIEYAYSSFIANSQEKTISQLLGLREPIGRNTAYTIPIMPIEKLEAYFKTYDLRKFRFIKVKVDSQNMVAFVSEIRRYLQNPLIIDANEAYKDPDKLLQDLELMNDHNLEFIEQPFPSELTESYIYLKKNTQNMIFADESITDSADFEMIKKCFHGVNIKLMKAGGFQNGIRLLKEAKLNGLKTMIGCMVESGLGIAGGYYLSSLADYLDLDSFMLLKNDPYPIITEKDGILSLASKANQS